MERSINIDCYVFNLDVAPPASFDIEKFHKDYQAYLNNVNERR